jgi:hypothetical protein
VAGYFKAADLHKVWMCIGIQAIHEQIVYPIPAKLPRREADTVDHQQIDVTMVRALILISRVVEQHTFE